MRTRETNQRYYVIFEDWKVFPYLWRIHYLIFDENSSESRDSQVFSFKDFPLYQRRCFIYWTYIIFPCWNSETLCRKGWNEYQLTLLNNENITRTSVTFHEFFEIPKYTIKESCVATSRVSYIEQFYFLHLPPSDHNRSHCPRWSTENAKCILAMRK